jgi:transposase, IS5 family
MREKFELRTSLFGQNIEDIKINPHSRHEISKLLLGFQEIYKDKQALDNILNILSEIWPKDVSQNTGRPGLNLWQIFVLGMVRLTTNSNYDALSDLADNHHNIRLFLHNGCDSDKCYPRQTLIDNLSLFTDEVLQKINHEVVKKGYGLTRKKSPEKCRIDSFVLETDAHYPTDITLIWDGVRSLIRLGVKAQEKFQVNGWRQAKAISKKVKRLLRMQQKIRHSKPKTAINQALKLEQVKTVAKLYQDAVISIIEKIDATILSLKNCNKSESLVLEMQSFSDKTKRVTDQLIRRVCLGESIPQSEKIFSMFEPHTEWICKGKAGISQELGVRVAVAEGDNGFILDWRVMYNETDDKVAVPMISKIKQQWDSLKQGSFDKGFWSPTNKIELDKLLDRNILPAKGKKEFTPTEKISEVEYQKARHQHSRIESAINALENHGLDRCLDHGKEAFTRYVGVAVVARNILQIGFLVSEKNAKIAQKEVTSRRIKKAA